MTARDKASFPLISKRWTAVIAAATIAALGMAGSASAQVTGFGGSAMTGWTPNNNAGTNPASAGLPSVSGSGTVADVLTLTTPNNGIATSYWNNTAQSITNFRETFTYTDNSTGGADGIAAVWQNAGTTALGGGGGSLGFAGIPTSAGLAMNIYGGNSGSGSQYNVVTSGTGVALTPTPGGVDITSGHPINVTLSYKEADGALTETMTDTTTSATFTRVWRGISIQGQVGAPTAIIGLTGATGGVNAQQSVTNFQFTPGAANATPVAAIKPIAATGYNQNMIVSAASGSANVTATMDGGTAKTGDTFYETGANPGTNVSGVPRAGATIGSANDSNHTFVLQPNGAGQNDAVMLDSANTTGTLTLTTPAKFSTLSFLLSSGNGAGTINATIHYAGGGTQSAVLAAPDWFNGGPIAVDANGRVDVALDDFNNVNNGQPRMFQADLALTDTVDNVLSVDFGVAGTATNRGAVFGISGTAVPEPSSLALLSLGAFGLLVRRRRAARAK
jgi:hypothetical protein